VKRISILSLSVAVAALATLAISTTGASASLCKNKGVSHSCSIESYYPGNTVIRGTLASEALVLTDQYGLPMLSCTGSEFEEYIVGPLYAGNTTSLGHKKFTVSGCSTPVAPSIPVTAHIPPGEPFTRIINFAGTDNGRWWGRGELAFRWWAAGVNCNYQLTEGELIGGSPAQVRYNKGAAYLLPSSGGLESSDECPHPVAKVTGTYNITSPTPLYVEAN
jgi:hypothetical protein